MHCDLGFSCLWEQGGLHAGHCGGEIWSVEWFGEESGCLGGGGVGGDGMLGDRSSLAEPS